MPRIRHRLTKRKPRTHTNERDVSVPETERISRRHTVLIAFFIRVVIGWIPSIVSFSPVAWMTWRVMGCVLDIAMQPFIGDVFGLKPFTMTIYKWTVVAEFTAALLECAYSILLQFA